MPISIIRINVKDVQRSVDFYASHLGATLVGEATADAAELDVVTATLQLTRTPEPIPSTWIPDDLQRGFRHVGFKVAAVDPLVAELDKSDVEFHLRPLDAEGDVRIAFFFDPDGTLLELVEGDLNYHDVHDAHGVMRERELGAPARPRFDHIGVTAASLESIRERYKPFGFDRIGSIHQVSDPRGFEIDYLKGGPTVLEVFTFTAPTFERPAQQGALGFASIAIDPDTVVSTPTADEFRSVSASSIGQEFGTAADGSTLYTDSDGLPVSVAR